MTTTHRPPFTINSDQRRKPRPTLTAEQRELHKQARAIKCPADGARFRHLIDNSFICARCGEHAGNITGATLPVHA